jgi:hypothetical protein
MISPTSQLSFEWTVVILCSPHDEQAKYHLEEDYQGFQVRDCNMKSWRLPKSLLPTVL